MKAKELILKQLEEKINEYDLFLELIWDIHNRGMEYKDIAKELWIVPPVLYSAHTGNRVPNLRKLKVYNEILKKL